MRNTLKPRHWILALVAALAFTTAALPAEATAPCALDVPCHNNFIEMPLLMALSADAWVGGIVSGAANATYTARGVRSSTAWPGLGYTFGAYNLGVGAWALAEFAISSSRWTAEQDGGYQTMMLAFGVPSLVLGVTDIALAVAAQMQPRAGRRPAALPVALTGSGRMDAPGLGVRLQF